MTQNGGPDTSGFRTEPIELRGPNQPLDVVLVAAADLARPALP